MALPSTLFRFRLDLSDIDRGVYESLDFRIAQHPSETVTYLVTRVLAYALALEEGLEFSAGGLSDADTAAMHVLSPNGGYKLWIEIGNPSARKLHKASKASRAVKVFTYKDPELLIKEMRSENVHKAEEIGIFSFAPTFLNALGAKLERDNSWSILHNEGSLVVTINQVAEQGEIQRHPYTSS